MCIAGYFRKFSFEADRTVHVSLSLSMKCVNSLNNICNQVDKEYYAFVEIKIFHFCQIFELNFHYFIIYVLI